MVPAEPLSATIARQGLDEAIQELQGGADKWAAASAADRAGLLTEVVEAIERQSSRWVRTAADIKGLSPTSPLVGEEWITGPYATLAGAGALAHTLAKIAGGGSPLDSLQFRTVPGGRQAVKVFPANLQQAVLLHGFSAEVWMARGDDEAGIRARAGLAALGNESGGVGLVLGAGNITSIAPLDVLYELVAHNRAVILKLNPVMSTMLTVYLDALDPLIRFGVVRIVQGDAATGGYLAHHPGIHHVHVTGSSATHDAVVFGTGEEGTARKAAVTPLLDKPITSELGGVSPTIVVPGTWTKRDLRFQAEHIATQRLHNAGHNCVATQVVMISRNWKQKGDFLEELHRAFENSPTRPVWYPGSADRLTSTAEAYPRGRKTGSAGQHLIVELDSTTDTKHLLETELFAPVMGILEIEGSGPDFMTNAVSIANNNMAGTLGANIIIDPKDRRAMGGAFDAAVAELRYGNIAINAWTGLGFLTATASWGAFPGHTVDAVQSGTGVVHNALLIENPERTVVSGPFRPFPRSIVHGELSLFPKPPWFISARSAAETGKLLAAYAAAPSWLKMPRIFWSAFRA